MHGILQRILLCFAGAVLALDAVWIGAGHFSIDVRNYGLLALFVPLIVGGALYYGRLRNEPAISATFAAAAFLVVISSVCCLLSYLLLTVAGPRIDNLLAGIDHAMGFSWPALMTLASEHQFATSLLRIIYLSVMPQILVLLLILGWKNRSADIYGLCLAIGFGAVIAIAVWAMFPSFGAFSVFNLPPAVAARLGLALSGDYGHDLVQMLKNGPGFITPAEMRGIVGFPSYHTVQALVIVWYARKLPYVRWLALGLNALVLIATPIHGGHHLIDLFGGAVVAAAAIALADGVVAWAARRGAAAVAVPLAPQSQPAAI